MAEKKRYIVVIPEEAQQSINELPEEMREAFEKLMTRMTEGDFSLEDEAQEMYHVNGLVLRCSKCRTDDIQWLYDGDDEYFFECNRCGEAGWLTKQEFRHAQRDFSDLLFEQRPPPTI